MPSRTRLGEINRAGVQGSETLGNLSYSLCCFAN